MDQDRTYDTGTKAQGEAGADADAANTERVSAEGTSDTLGTDDTGNEGAEHVHGGNDSVNDGQ